MNKILPIILAVVLSGCAYFKDKHDKYMNTWMGTSEQEMLSIWGGPSNVYENNGMKYITWARGGSVVFPSMDGSAGTVVPTSCTRTFVFQNGIVVSWSYRGNDCY